MDNIKQQLQQAADFILKRLDRTIPSLGIFLGSGLGKLTEFMTDKIVISTSEIPHWPPSTVQGHAGKLIIGKLGEVPLVALQGRVHYYEGYAMQRVVFPMRVLGWLGIRKMVVTNAAGGINPGFNAGDFMLIRDHINLMGNDPLIGPNMDDLGPRFPDMSQPYDPNWIDLAEKIGQEIGLIIHRGVLIGTHGPSYETSSEIKMMQRLGGDAVCMSTVPEVIAGVHMGMRILGISLISNKAAGLSSNQLSHEDVQKMAEKNAHPFSEWIGEIVQRIIT